MHCVDLRASPYWTNVVDVTQRTLQALDRAGPAEALQLEFMGTLERRAADPAGPGGGLAVAPTVAWGLVSCFESLAAAVAGTERGRIVASLLKVAAETSGLGPEPLEALAGVADLLAAGAVPAAGAGGPSPLADATSPLAFGEGRGAWERQLALEAADPAAAAGGPAAGPLHATFFEQAATDPSGTFEAAAVFLLEDRPAGCRLHVRVGVTNVSGGLVRDAALRVEARGMLAVPAWNVAAPQVDPGREFTLRFVAAVGPVGLYGLAVVCVGPEACAGPVGEFSVPLQGLLRRPPPGRPAPEPAAFAALWGALPCRKNVLRLMASRRDLLRQLACLERNGFGRVGPVGEEVPGLVHAKYHARTVAGGALLLAVHASPLPDGQYCLQLKLRTSHESLLTLEAEEALVRQLDGAFRAAAGEEDQAAGGGLEGGLEGGDLEVHRPGDSVEAVCAAEWERERARAAAAAAW